MTNMLTRLWKEEQGQGMTEYGLIIALVALAAILGLTAFGGKLQTFFNDLVTKF